MSTKVRPASSSVSRSSSQALVLNSPPHPIGINTIEIFASSPAVRFRTTQAKSDESLLSFLHRATGGELEALKTTVLISTLARRFGASDLERGVGEIVFPTFPVNAQYSALENLIVVIPKEFLLLNGASEQLSLVPTRLPALSSLSWSTLRELLTSLYSVLPILEVLVYKLPRLLWTPEAHEMRARLLPSQQIISEIPTSGQNLKKLCDDADKVFLDMDPRRSWLKLFDEKSIRDNLAELSRLLSSPRPVLVWQLLEYPSYSVSSSTISGLTTRLAQEVSKLSIPGADTNTAVRQSIYDTVCEVHQHISATFNMVVVKMANARQDAWTWSENRARLERDAELVLDYERMLNARNVAERFQSEMNHLKALTRRHQKFTESTTRLLPTDLAVLYQKEYLGALSDRASSPSASSSNSSSMIASPSALASSGGRTASPIITSTSPQAPMSPSIDAALYKSRQDSALSKRLSELEEERTELRRMNAKLTNDNALLKSKVATENTSTTALEEAKRELAELQATYAAELSRATELSDSISEQFAQKAEFQMNAKRAEERAANFSIELEQSRADRTRLTSELEQSRVRAAEADASLDMQKRVSEKALADATRLGEDLKKLEADLRQREEDLEMKEKMVRLKEDELSLKEAQNLQLSDEIESLRHERAQSSTDALFAHRLNEESGEDPLRADLAGRSKEELVNMFLNYWTRFQEAEQRATQHAQIAQRIQAQVEALLKQQSLRHSND